MMCIVCILIVFFVKQKTAYEMRISDWSSDVCSSDLLRCLAGGDGFRLLVGGLNKGFGALGKIAGQIAAHAALQLCRFRGIGFGVGIEALLPFGLLLPSFFLAVPVCIAFGGNIEIGRAHV